MDEKGINFKNIVKNELKGLAKKAVIVILIIAFLLLMFYRVLNDDFNKVSKTSATYSATINQSGQITYIKTLEDGTTQEVTTEQMAEDLKPILKDYISDDDEVYNEKIDYLVGAEAVTKLPYIEPEFWEEDQQIGQIKFYRYRSQAESDDAYTTDSEGNEILKETYRLTYVSPETFKAQFSGYEHGGNQEVFKHFTIDEEGKVVVAYGSTEVRNIITDDKDLTLEIVKEVSGEDKYSGNSKDGFSFVEYKIHEKAIDYLSLVEQYVMPTNMLYALLIQTKDIDFVEAVANLAYNNEIAIGIYDNNSQSQASEVYNYKKIMNISGNTNLDFSKVGTTQPKIYSYSLYNIPYSRIPYRCYMNTSGGIIEHRLHYLLPSEAPEDIKKADSMYIGKTNADGKITSLTGEGAAEEYSTTFSKQVNATSTPTIGVFLADTWIATWKATYTHQPNDSTGSSDSDTNQDVNLILYESKDAVLDAFNGTMKNSINNKLNSHAQSLKDSAITKIVDSTDFKVTPTKISVDDLTVAKKKEVLQSHINGCAICSAAIEKWWKKPNIKPAIESIYLALTSNNGTLKGTKVENDYNTALKNYVSSENKKRENEAKKKEKENEKNFKKELESQISYTQTLTGNKQYTNITFSTSHSRTSSKYEKEDTISTTDEGVKFSEVFNDKEFYEAKQAILQRDMWLWEYMRENEDTAKLEDILRYLLNKAINSNRFGTFSEEELEELFKAFEPKKEMKVASIPGMKLLRDYIRTWEAGSMLAYINGESEYTERLSKYISEDKTHYYINDDGKGHPTVGFGVDIFSSGFVDDLLELGYTEAQLRNTSGTIAVPVDIVDEKEEVILQAKLKEVKQETAALDLKTYQIYALVSRAYNCGTDGALQGYSSLNFVESYQKYFNPEEDDLYGEMQGDFGHALYKNFMSTPVTSDGVKLAGLVRRRKSEWTLFQTGYMDILDKWVSANSGIIDWAEEIHTYMEENAYTYCVYFCNGGEECSNKSECGLNLTFEESKVGHQKTCCATYVSWVLIEADYLKREECKHGADTLRHLLQQKGWTEVENYDDLEPGDVLYYPGHVDIYAGDDTKYNAGGGSCIRDPAPSKITSGSLSFYGALRAPY